MEKKTVKFASSARRDIGKCQGENVRSIRVIIDTEESPKSELVSK